MQTAHAEEKKAAGELFWRVHLHCEVIAQGGSGHELQEVGDQQRDPRSKRDARLPLFCHVEIVLFSKS